MNDFIFNGQASGSVASVLLANDFDVNALRPYFSKKGTPLLTRNMGGKLVTNVTNNANTTLRKDDWKLLDDAIIKVGKERLRAVADLRSSGLQFTIPNGMGKTVLEYETQSDISAATISMDGRRRSDKDRPVYNLVNLPLPIIHKDFGFSARQLATSRSGGSPLDTSTAELAARRVIEEAEKLLLGTSATYSYGGGTIYGYTNFPDRLTKTLTAPTSANHATTVSEVLQMKTQSQDAFHYGPWWLYCSTSWDEFMDEDYSTAKGENTLRDRLRKIEGITDVITLDLLPTNTLLMVQQTSDVVREVIGLDLTTVQWEEEGGMDINFKVMAIMVPQLRSDHNLNTGIVHATHA